MAATGAAWVMKTPAEAAGPRWRDVDNHRTRALEIAWTICRMSYPTLPGVEFESPGLGALPLSLLDAIHDEFRQAWID